MFKWIKKINKKLDFTNDCIDMICIFNDKNSKIHCQNCKCILPFFRLILKAKSVKNNDLFEFKCNRCKYINLIKKEV